MEEIWKKIPNFENYEISSYGRQRKGDKIFKLAKYTNGYVCCVVYKNNKRKCYLMHRLVMELFNPDRSEFKSMPYENRNEIDLNRLEVNHIDENIENNNINNLEWCTPKYNANYGNRPLKCRMVNKRFFKRVCQLSYDGNTVVRTYETVSDAAKSVNGDASYIARVCNSINKSAYGYKWKWYN